MEIENVITVETHNFIVEEIYQMRNLYLLRIQELIEDGKYEDAIKTCQKLIR
jgi:hypothetical protein